MGSSTFRKFGLGVLVVVLLGYLIGIHSILVFIPILLLVVAIILGAEYWQNRNSKNPLRLLRGKTEFLCDDCKWNYGNVCTRPERPNATTCPDYKPK